MRKLDPDEFIQIHRGTLVNVGWVAETHRTAEGKQTVVLRDTKATELSVGRHYADNLKCL